MVASVANETIAGYLAGEFNPEGHKLEVRERREAGELVRRWFRSVGYLVCVVPCTVAPIAGRAS
jgi:hypothetical protein